MKILFTGPLSDGHSGWAIAGSNFIRALDAAGANLVVRPYKLNEDKPELHPRVLELMENDESGVTHVVHCGLPHLFVPAKHKQNIGIVFTESRNYKMSSWPSYMNTMDKIITASSYAKAAAINSGVKVPVNYFGVPIDFSRYDVELPPLDTGTYNDFRFLFVGDSSLRKNLPSLIRAFHSEFSPNEPVSLVIKIGKYGAGPEFRDQVIQTIEQIRSGLRIRKNYKKEVLITEPLSEKNLLQLHNACDAIVAPSFGEGWNLPVIDSLSMGKMAIATDTGGFRDYCPILVPSFQTPCYGIHDTFDGLMDSNDMWQTPDIRELQKMMRWVYSQPNLKELGNKNKSQMKRFSLETVGKNILDWIA